MSLPAAVSFGADRVNRIAPFGKPPGVSSARHRSNAPMRRCFGDRRDDIRADADHVRGVRSAGAVFFDQGFH